ncbi:MAG: rhamnulokinase [Bryobacterales bacterium]|nr:rhamnulokinase [Bryobacterales bacterium]
MSNFLAVDLGAESGRAILGSLADGRLEIAELHRFANTPVRIPAGLYWDTFRLFHEIQEGLRLAGRDRRVALDGVGIDTWGVDFGLIGADGGLVDNPRHYRDARNNAMLETTFERVPREEIFRHTGLQFMQFNSLFQLHAIQRSNPRALAAAEKMLWMPDLFNFWLTGVARAELTIASTSQMYNPVERRWATELLSSLDIPTSILPRIVQPGAFLGPLLPHVAEFAGLGETPVYATGCHDTASAVAAVPATGQDWCYISSGTWSLMGVELDEPVVTGRCLELTFTNEIGAEGKVRLLKNIAGLWLLQECRRAWALEGTEYSYATLAGMANAARPFAAQINPDAFLEPGRLPEKIAGYCRSTHQQPPADAAETARVILESLALRYRQVLEMLESMLGRRLGVIHIVGGGAKNSVLNQLVADATQRTVVAGPTEATAIGNVVIQAMGAGGLRGLAEARDVIRRSFPLTVVEPRSAAGWDAAYERFVSLPR